jgi:hypothetical protein
MLLKWFNINGEPISNPIRITASPVNNAMIPVRGLMERFDEAGGMSLTPSELEVDKGIRLISS